MKLKLSWSKLKKAHTLKITTDKINKNNKEFSKGQKLFNY